MKKFSTRCLSHRSWWNTPDCENNKDQMAYCGTIERSMVS